MDAPERVGRRLVVKVARALEAGDVQDLGRAPVVGVVALAATEHGARDHEVGAVTLSPPLVVVSSMLGSAGTSVTWASSEIVERRRYGTSAHQVAAVHHELLASDVARFLAGEEQLGLGDVDRRSGPLNGTNAPIAAMRASCSS